MRADTANQNKHIPNSKSKAATLTLIFSVLTMVFALSSMITGHRLATLEDNYRKTLIASAESGADSLTDMKTGLESTRANLTTTQKALAEEKKATHRLQKKIQTITKNMEKVQADLATANQTIADLTSGLSKTPSPASSALPSPALAPEDPLVQKKE